MKKFIKWAGLAVIAMTAYSVLTAPKPSAMTLELKEKMVVANHKAELAKTHRLNVEATLREAAKQMAKYPLTIENGKINYYRLEEGVAQYTFSSKNDFGVPMESVIEITFTPKVTEEYKILNIKKIR